MRYKERKIGYCGIQNKRSSESEKREEKTQHVRKSTTQRDRSLFG
jgi:hypothetical protein